MNDQYKESLTLQGERNRISIMKMFTTIFMVITAIYVLRIYVKIRTRCYCVRTLKSRGKSIFLPYVKNNYLQKGSMHSL